MFLDRESGRPVRLPDISYLSQSSEMPEGFQGQPLQNFQLDPYSLHAKQSLPATNHPVTVDLGLGKAQYYSQPRQLLQKNPQAQQFRDMNSNLAIRTNDSNANLMDDAEIIKHQN